MIGIYCIKNIVNNKVYIGQSTDLKSRIQHHKSYLRHNKHDNDYLQKSWNKYGEDNFVFSVLEYCDEDKLDELERKYIQEYNSINEEFGYNFETGGSAHKHMSEAARRKMSLSRKGKYVGENNPMFGKPGKKPTEEMRRYLSEKFSGAGNPMYGVHREHSEAERKLMSEKFKGAGNPFYGEHHTEETKKILSEKHKGRSVSRETILRRHQNKRVRCVNNGMEFDALSFAAQWAGDTAPESISRVCYNKQKTAGHDPITKEKLKWEFI